MGDTTRLRGFYNKLLVLHDQHTSFNIMEYLIERIKAAAFDQEKSAPFAPYIQKLINHVVKDKKNVMDTKHKDYKTKKELSMFDPKDLELPSKIKRGKISKPQASNVDGEGPSSTTKAIEERLADISTKEIMVIFMKSEVTVNDSLSRSLYLQDKLRRDHDQIKFVVNKILVKQGEQLVEEEEEQSQQQAQSPPAQDEDEDTEASASPSSDEGDEDENNDAF